jgi:hypothetical protein
MTDFGYLAVTIVLFLASLGLIRLCERLMEK